MEDSGGRQFEHHTLIKISSIRFLREQEIDALKSIILLKPYIEKRSAEIAAYNKERGLDGSNPVNGRRLTNVGLFRQYIDAYLAQHPGIHPDMTRMVRQHAPNEFQTFRALLLHQYHRMGSLRRHHVGHLRPPPGRAYLLRPRGVRAPRSG